MGCNGSPIRDANPGRGNGISDARGNANRRYRGYSQRRANFDGPVYSNGSQVSNPVAHPVATHAYANAGQFADGYAHAYRDCQPNAIADGRAADTHCDSSTQPDGNADDQSGSILWPRGTLWFAGGG